MILPFRWRCVVAVLAAIALGLLYLMVSERIGRLSMDLQYDDVSYAVDAVDRYEALRHGGIGALGRSLVHAPTHSPYSVLLGVAAFLALGVHELSLYAANMVLLLGAALLVAILTRDRSDGTFALALLFALASPLAFHAQVEYRPDPALGLATAAMTLAFASAALDGRPARARLAGVFFGLCLLVKPTFFAHTLALALLLCGIGLVARWRRLPAGLHALALPPRELAGFLAIGALVAAPYYATAAGEIFGYFWSNTFGSHGHVHNLPGRLGPWQVLVAFEPYVFQLSRYHMYAAAAAVVLVVPLLALKGLAREALRAGVLGLTALASMAIIFAGRQPSPFFFASAGWLWIAAAIVGLAALAASLRPRARAALYVAAAVALAPLTWYSFQNLRGAWPPGAQHGASANVRVLAAMREDLLRMGVAGPPPALQVLVDSSGPVNPVVLRWVGRLVDMNVYGDETHLAEDPAPLMEKARASDYLVLIHPDRAPFDQWLPVRGVQRAMLDWALGQPGFERLDAGSDATYTLFANRSSTRRFVAPGVVAANGGILAVKGLSGDANSRPRRIEATNAVACFSLQAGHPMHATVQYASTQAGTLDMRIRGEIIAKADMAPGRGGELVATFTPVSWASTCIDLHVEAANPAAAPEVSLRAFVVGPAV